ncbi:glycosyltransferase family 4 protein [Sinomonas terrae]|uniref:D-inositol 3-phosphate glycosyltransferase n=1 Tax=Sinomonas terrae TaxID=2908838 RepID=A0ABS9U5J8_9MICC|nr:glycosyltransferase family 4 protein [Sinomonas terrae]MCH6471812.1 glycosyltransferase family 4 protein [Sinomonas terrae]
MKIIHVTNVIAPDKLGGLERYVRELAASFVTEGHEVVVISKATTPCAPEKESGEDGVLVRRHPSPPKSSRLFAIWYPFMVFSGVRRILREEVSRSELANGSTIIHAHFPVPTLALALLRIPFVYTFHAPVYRELVGERQGSYAMSRFGERMAVLGMKAAERFVLKRARVVLTLSDFTAREARELGVPSRKIRVVPGGLDEARFAWHGTSDGPATDDDGGRGPRLFAARRFVERTGVEQLVEAMPAVREAVPHITLRLAGTGPREADIRALIERLDLVGVVQLLGRISDEQLVSEYTKATLSVTPTLYLEGFGLSTAESLSLGTPALVTPVGANPELVAGLSPSLLSDGTSPDALADALIRLLNDQQALEALRRRLRSGFAAKWGWSNVVRQLNDVYEALLR